ncbi:MAG: iron complex outerrane recepter protein [Gammaproteobacteria bacterium]|nr:iron complex outerrane recepter protein [Gammaproteobacteria bacterium]
MFRAVVATAAAAALLLGAIDDAAAQTSPANDSLQEIVVSGDRLDVMQTKPVDSVFGFDKTVLETPRSLTTITNDLLTKTIITTIDDLVALTPGAFTQSFFGVAGSLDVRGTAGENYFRGVRRIDNPGNYPTPIGASDSIDIVRGPASPIFGPSKVGGYLNFNPKFKKAVDGDDSAPAGEFEATGGSWGKKVLHAEVTGPSTMFGKALGYSLYVESEDSGSYYENSSTRQTLAQVSFDLKLSDSLHSEFGAQYQHFLGNQVAGWNRVTQNLIDNGTYITGSPTNLDTNHDGLLSQAEANAANIGTGSNFLFEPNTMTAAQITAALAGNPNLGLVNPGTAHINGSQVLVAAGDVLGDNVTNAYWDLIFDLSDGAKITNKTYYEYLDNINENAYGFSQYAKTWAFEDQLNVTVKLPVNDWLSTNLEFGPSVRYQNFDFGDDFNGEFFDRRDITKPSSPIDARTLATRGQDAYTDHIRGNYTDAGLALLADTAFFQKLNLLAGVRGDYFDMKSNELLDATSTPGLKAARKNGAFSYSASLSYDLPGHVVPYVTYAKQVSIITGEGGDIDPSQLSQGNAIAASTLKEVGIKTNQLDSHLFMAVDYFIQQRTDFAAQDEVSNNTTQAKGLEFETRFVVNPELTVTGAFTSMSVYNLSAAASGTQFTFVGGQDLQGANPALIYGGAVGSVFAVSPGGSLKAGLPKTIASLNFLGSADPWIPGLSGSVAITHSSFAYSGFSQSVKLPAYTLVNAGLRFERGKWAVNAQVKNLTDARYFRSNFPDLFGSSVVLPELPRNYLLSGTYKF